MLLATSVSAFQLFANKHITALPTVGWTGGNNSKADEKQIQIKIELSEQRHCGMVQETIQRSIYNIVCLAEYWN